MSTTSNMLSNSNTVNKERNKIRKNVGDISKKDNKNNMQNPSQHEVRHKNFLLKMVNI